MKELGIYIHIPFCSSKCYYCDFISFSNKDELVERYINAVKNDNRELTKLKIRSSLEKPQTKNQTHQKSSIDENKNNMTLSIKNKTLYEQTMLNEPSENGDISETENKNQDDNFLSNFSKSKNILQKDIKEEFNPTGPQ